MPTTVPAAREREAGGTRSAHQTRSRIHPRWGFAPEVSALRVPQGGGHSESISRRQQEPSRSGFCSGGRRRQDVVALPSDILRQPKEQPLPPSGRPRDAAARAPGQQGSVSSGVAGCAESRSGLPAPAAPSGPEQSSGRGKRAPGRGMGPGRRPRAEALAPAPPSVPCVARPGPRPPDPTPPQQRALAGARGAPRYLGSDPAGRSPRRCHSALREIDTQTQLGFAGRPAAADLAPAGAPLAPRAQGQGEARGRGGGRRAAGMEAAASLPRIRRFFSERPRPIAAILTGFSHNTGNLARSRENPFPSPRASPAPSGISPALPWRRAAGSGDAAPRAQGPRCRPRGGGARGRASSRSGPRGRGDAPDPLGARLLGGDVSHDGTPIDEFTNVEDASPPAAAETVVKTGASWEEAGMRPADHLLKPSCVLLALAFELWAGQPRAPALPVNSSDFD